MQCNDRAAFYTELNFGATAIFRKILGKFFLGTEDLHFGYWPDGEKPTARNFALAQENHSKLIMTKIPRGAKRILDVGSGSGNLAQKLLNSGYEVDCVIPSEYLAKAVKEKLS